MMTWPEHFHVVSTFTFSSIQPILSKTVRQIRFAYKCTYLVFEICI